MTVIDWLLDADPAIRWQVMRDLTDATADEVAAERARVAVEGWGAQLLALQGPDGQWDGGTYRPGWVDESKPFFDAWTATTFSLLLLRDLGAGSGRSRRPARRRPGPRQREVGCDRRAVLRGRDRAVHQRFRGSTSVPTSARASTGSSTASWPVSSRTAAGIAGPSTGRPCPRSTRRSASSRGCSRGSAREERPRTWRRRGEGATPT